MTIYRFECLKSFNSTEIYKNDNDDEIQITNLWKYATLEFTEDEMPERESNGNYYDIYMPESFDCSDLFASNIDVFTDDDELKERIVNIQDDEKFVDQIIKMGFYITKTQYDILDNGEDSINVIEIE